MPRVISLFLPSWPTDRLRRSEGAPPDEQPLALVGHDGRRRVVTAANGPARDAGLRPGIAASQARLLLPGLVLREADPAADLGALRQLGLWLLRRLSPVVALDPPDGLVIGADGLAHLHGGEAAMLARLVARLRAAGIEAHAALASSRGAAHALARFPPHPLPVVPTERTREALAPLPLAALRLPAEAVRQFAVLGLHRIGDLLAQPRGPIARRFGPEPFRRLDQALGLLAEPFDALVLPDVPQARRAFAEPISAAETIAHQISLLLPELCAALERRGLGVRHLDLACWRVDRQTQVVRVSTSAALRDPGRLGRLLGERIASIDPGFGIEALVLTATATEPFERRQGINALVSRPAADLSDLLDLLMNRVGPRRLYRIQPVASDVPERSLRRVPPLTPMPGPGWDGAWPRPVRLLSPPDPIETVAMLPDHPPASFTWRGVRRRVRRADGPERIFGEWWANDNERSAVRDYFQVEDEAGARFWIFRTGDGEDARTGPGRWFLHGIFG